MSVHERAGTPARPEDLVDVPALLAAYSDVHPDPKVDVQRVAFGTSGHRGSALLATFNDDHIAATSQAIVEYRAAQGTDGPLFLGRDSHALSEPAWRTAAEVFAANGVELVIDSRDGLTPTPAQPAYAVGDVGDQKQAIELLITAESDCQVGWRSVLDNAEDPGLRRLALDGLTTSATRATRWRLTVGRQPAVENFPGQPS